MRTRLRYSLALGATLLYHAADAQTTPAGGVGIGTATPDASALLDLTSSSKGMLAPRLTAAQRAAIARPAQGLLVYQTDGVQLGFWYYSGTAWTYLNPTPAGDNLGNHTATQNLNLATYQLVGNGGTSGLSISNAGNVQLNGPTAVAGGVTVDVAAANGGGFPQNAFNFGAPASGEGIASNRTGSLNQYGLDLYTNSLSRLSITNVGNVGIGTATPAHKLAVAGNIGISGVGNSLVFPDGTQQTTAASTQSLGLSGQTLTLTNGGSVTLPTQSLAVSGQNLSISGGNTVALPTQTLGINGQTLSLTNGNSVTLPTTPGDNLGNHTATQNLNLATYQLVGNGGASGLSISNDGNVGIGTTTPDGKAALDITSTTKGFLPPRLTTTQRDAIAPASTEVGLVIFNTTTQKMEVWNGSSWGSALMNNDTGSPTGTTTFNFTGGAQTWTVPAGVTSVQVDLGGAQGTNYNTNGGGLGGRVTATLKVTPGQVLNIYVGGSGGYNGGGSIPYSPSGGGGTDIRIGGTALGNRVVVAGGGGGGGVGYSMLTPGGAGGFIGQKGTADSQPYQGSAQAGSGGQQTSGGNGGSGAPTNGGTSHNPSGSNGSLGQGGAGGVISNNFGGGNPGGGGGGGYYGGGGGSFYAGGGGGSSYVNPAYASGVQYYTGARGGNGYVTIMPVPTPYLGLANAQLGINSGAVLFSNSGSIGGDASNLSWDNSAKRLGIGTASPAATLDVTGTAAVSGALSVGGAANFGVTTRQMLNLYSTNYGIGVQGSTEYFRTDGGFAWYTGGSHDDNALNSGGGATQMILKNNSLGIGASTDPIAPLEIRRDNASAYLVMHDPGNNYFSFGQDQAAGNNIKISDGNGFGGTNYLTIQRGTGNVGIGTSSPKVRLEVAGGSSIGSYSYYFLNINGTGSYTGGANDISILTNGRVVASEFNATSDRRLKTVVGLSNGAADLGLLNKLRITDYTMRDRVQYGTQRFKKVIAQEVEAVFPQAVSQHAGFLPDVYAVAAKAETQADSLLVLTLPAAPAAAAHAGQRIKLIGKAGEVVGTVHAASGARLVVRGARQLAGQQVFVFGLEHPDVRSVDYEALAMLNVSATQELARQLAELQKQNAALQQQTQAQTTRLGQQQTMLEQQQAALRTLQAQATLTADLAQRLQALESQLGAKASVK